MALESWEMIIFDLAIGSLISGVLLFFFSIFTAGFHFGHVSHGGGHSGHFHIGHFHIGHLHLGHLHVGHFHFGHTGHVSAHAQHQARFDQNPSTPIFLIIAAFMQMFGAVGTVNYQSEILTPFYRILLVILIPLACVKLVDIAWNRIAGKEYGYEIPTVAIDNQVKTLTSVDEKGGLVLADTGDLNRPESLNIDEKIKMIARTLPGVVIERDQIAYVIDIDQKNTLVIDLWPKPAKKETS